MLGKRGALPCDRKKVYPSRNVPRASATPVLLLVARCVSHSSAPTSSVVAVVSPQCPPLRQQRPSQPSTKADHMVRVPHWKIKMAQAGYKHVGSCSVPATDAFTRHPPFFATLSFCILEQLPTSATHLRRRSRSRRLPTIAVVIRWRRRPSNRRTSLSTYPTCAPPA